MNVEEVILVNENDVEIGVMEKMAAHEQGLLHRAFSIFIFNNEGEMLLQQRAFSKYHSGGLWTNACCSHPKPNELTEQAAVRRLQEELGFVTPLHYALNFTYKAHFANGLTEHEFDHVFIGQYDDNISPNIEEVADYKYVSLEVIKTDITSQPQIFTEWFLIAFPKIEQWLETNGTSNSILHP